MSDTEDAAAGGSAKPAAPLFVSPIATPLAGKKLHKKLYKATKKAAGAKVLRRGVKEVVKALRKGEKGLLIIAADIFPVDVISHLPLLAEDNSVPYCYVKSKAELGAAATTKRPTSVVLISTTKLKKDVIIDKLEDCLEEVKSITPSY